MFAGFGGPVNSYGSGGRKHRRRAAGGHPHPTPEQLQPVAVHALQRQPCQRVVLGGQFGVPRPRESAPRSRAGPTRSACSRMSAKRSVVPWPCCSAPKKSPWPRIRRSAAAISNPSVVPCEDLETLAGRSALPTPPPPRPSRNHHAEDRPGRRVPTRPRSWCSWESPKRSAFSITMTVALATSIPTSMTVVATSTWISPATKPRMTRSRSSAGMRPCRSATLAARELLAAQAFVLGLGGAQIGLRGLLDDRGTRRRPARPGRGGPPLRRTPRRARPVRPAGSRPGGGRRAARRSR